MGSNDKDKNLEMDTRQGVNIDDTFSKMTYEESRYNEEEGATGDGFESGENTDGVPEVFEGFRLMRCKRFFYLFCSVITLGVLPLVCFWYPKLWLKMNTQETFHAIATHIYAKDISDELDEGEVCEVKFAILDPEVASRHLTSIRVPRSSVSSSTSSGGGNEHINLIKKSAPCLKYFVYRKLRHILNVESMKFQQIRGLDKETPVGWFVEQAQPMTVPDVKYKLEIYGPNTISVAVTPIWKLALTESMNPFYIFQVASVIFWSLDDYYVYAACIFFISLISVAISAVETHRQQRSLHKMTQVTASVGVYRIMDGSSSVSRNSDQKRDSITMTSSFSCKANDGLSPVQKDSSELVPGDVVTLSDLLPSTLTFDAVLVSGSCVVNESMLTGESVPVMKCPLSPTEYGGPNGEEYFDIDTHKRHVLFSGTQIVQLKNTDDNPVKAVIIRTGFLTSKGELVRSILYPRPLSFEFYKDSLKFVFALSIVSVIGLVYTLIVLYNYNEPTKELILRPLDIITICVPPALPAALTVAIVYAQSRLKSHKVFCIAPKRINVAGRINLVCYDKTGTITEEGLDVRGVMLCQEGGTFLKESSGQRGRSTQDEEQQPKLMTSHDDLMIEGYRGHDLLCALASTHALTSCPQHSMSLTSEMTSSLEDDQKCEPDLTGDPLDLKMFNFTNWKPKESTANSSSGLMLQPPSEKDRLLLGVSSIYQLKLYPFVSEMQRMSVVAQVIPYSPNKTLEADDKEKTGASSSGTFKVFCKGSPEIVSQKCKNSTVPDNFLSTVTSYCEQGFRLIALASKSIEEERGTLEQTSYIRSELERDLDLLGVLILENKLKEDSAKVIQSLDSVGIRQVMITGDNLSTAVCVAKQCGIIRSEDKVIRVSSRVSGGIPVVGFHLLQQEKEMEKKEQRPESDQTADCGTISLNYHFVMDGDCFATLESLYPNLLKQILMNASVFGRMKPKQKSSLVNDFGSLGYTTCMCGDGSNDCGALKSADVGISLSQAEASIAAPFTSKCESLSCVPEVIKEGRCSLSTSFSMIKFMVLYSMIQFFTVVLLTSADTNMGDFQFLYIDLILITSLALVMSRTGPPSSANDVITLGSRRPSHTLMNYVIIGGVLAHAALTIITQLVALLLLRHHKWYEKPEEMEKGKGGGDGTGDNEEYENYDTTVLFSVSIFQYLFVALAFSKGPPHRATPFSNYLFVLVVTFLTLFNLVLLFQSSDQLSKLLLMVSVPSSLKISMLILLVANIVLAIFIEYVCDHQSLSKYTLEKSTGYRELTESLRGFQNWPPVNEVFTLDNRQNLDRSPDSTT